MLPLTAIGNQSQSTRESKYNYTQRNVDVNWKNGDYFGASGCSLDEQKVPVVIITSPEGTSTTFVFTSATNYPSFLIWATWGPLEQGYTLIIKKIPRRESNIDRSEAEQKRVEEMMADFRSYSRTYH